MKTHCGTKSLSHYNSGNPRFEAQSSLRSERKSSGESGGGRKDSSPSAFKWLDRDFLLQFECIGDGTE